LVEIDGKDKTFRAHFRIKAPNNKKQTANKIQKLNFQNNFEYWDFAC
jgi:hypothetical protein